MSTYQTWQQRASFKHCEWDSPELTSNLELKNLDAPSKDSLAPGSVLVRIHAASLNFRDLLAVSNTPTYPLPLNSGTAPCLDGAGEVVATGPSSKWKLGDRVILTPHSWHSGSNQRDFGTATVLGSGDEQGTLRQLAVLADSDVVSAPSNLTYEEACCLPASGVVCMRALLGEQPEESDGLQEGDWILTLGTGSVSLWAIKLASIAGAKVIATSSSDAKLELAKKLGAAYTINYAKYPEWHEEVLRITEGRGVDRVIDVVGGGTIVESLKSTRFGGSVHMLGMLSEGDESGVAALILQGAKSVLGQLTGSNEILSRLVSYVEKHDVHPVIGEIFELQKALDAFEALQKQSTVGKIVITM